MDIELNPADRVRMKFTSIGFDHDWLFWDRMYHHLFTSNINSPMTAYIVRDSLDAEETFKTILSSVDIHFKSKWVENWRTGERKNSTGYLYRFCRPEKGDTKLLRKPGGVRLSNHVIFSSPRPPATLALSQVGLGARNKMPLETHDLIS